MADYNEPQVEIIPPSRSNGARNGSRRSNNASKDVDFTDNVTFYHQFIALFMKDLSSQSKAIGTNICQIVVPIVLISFTGIIQLVMNHLLQKKGAVMPGSGSLPIPIDVGKTVPCEMDPEGHPSVCYDPILNYILDFDYEEWEPFINDIGTGSEILHKLNQSGILPKQNILFDLPYYYIGKDPSVDLDLGSSTEGLQGLMLPESYRFNFSLDFKINPNFTNRSFVLEENNETRYDGDSVELPFFLPIEGNNTRELQKQLLKVVREYNKLANTSAAASDQYDRNYYATPQSQEQYNATIEDIQSRNFTKTKPHGGIFFTKFENTTDSVDLGYTLINNDITLYQVFGLNLNSSNVSSQLRDTELQRRSNIINMVHNGILKTLLNETGVPQEPNIVTYVMPFPPHEQPLVLDITDFLGGLLFPFAASFLFPIFIGALVKDKHERHLIMMEQNGLQRSTYWVITYIFNYFLYILIAIVIAVVSLAWQIRLFTQTNALVIFLVFCLWGHAQVVLGFFFSNFFNSPQTATIVGYIFVIAGVIVSLVLEIVQVFPPDQSPFFLYMMYPPFAFYRSLFYMLSACASFQCYGISVLSSSNGLSLLSISLLYLAGSTILLLFVGFYLSYVLPSEYGVRKSPFFPITWIFKKLLLLVGKIGIGGKSKNKFGIAERQKSNDDEHVDIDEDVQAEDDRLGEEFPPDSPVVIYRLRKEYPSSGGKPPHVAVKSISLAIDRNECFGLLGPNGAGKTTLISVLTGLYEPSNGIARIAGYNLLTEMNSIHRHLGVCPQFDIQYPELTCEEHLLFYARLKGVKSFKKSRKVVKRALQDVNLLDARAKRSKNLSGGMRRRLSVAMACIGNPDILILDEPTTGLDPTSKRQVWEVIDRVKMNRSVILTTHAMEEADYLCTRIGIMNFGRLCCIGSQSHLKNKFGTGYELKFHCIPGKANNVERFVQNNLNGAIHIETYADTCSYRMDKDRVVMSELFELLDSVRDQIGIVDWGIKMTTLEDVFLNIVRNYSNGSGDDSEEGNSCCPSWLPAVSCNCSSPS